MIQRAVFKISPCRFYLIFLQLQAPLDTKRQKQFLSMILIATAMEAEYNYVKESLDGLGISPEKYMIGHYGLGYKSGIGVGAELVLNPDIDTVLNFGFAGALGYDLGETHSVERVSPLFTEEDEGDDHTIECAGGGVLCTTSPKFVSIGDVDRHLYATRQPQLFDMELLHLVHASRIAGRGVKLYSVKVVSDNLLQANHSMSAFNDYIKSVRNPFDKAVGILKELF